MAEQTDVPDDVSAEYIEGFYNTRRRHSALGVRGDGANPTICPTILMRRAYWQRSSPAIVMTVTPAFWASVQPLSFHCKRHTEKEICRLSAN
jgi:hypothetical protein